MRYTPGLLIAVVCAAALCGCSKPVEPTAAKPAAAAAPALNLEGAWSGVMTTRDNDFWRVEDWACFNGCTDKTVAQVRELLNDPANDKLPVMALIGRSWGMAREEMKSHLTAPALEIFAKISDETDPTLNCEPYGFAREVVNALPIKISKDGANLVIDYEEWSQKRTIYMDGTHPKDVPPTMMGHSTGRYENGALVVDTVGLAPDIFYPAYSGGGYSEQAHAVERYTVAEDPRRLQVEVTIEDPKMLTEPYTFRKVWLHVPDLELVHDSCKDYPTKP
ncbi:MAG: hypothetical protein ABI640_01810 [Gammaproteobacteria bacterium]